MATPLFHYTYVLLSEKDNGFYVGSTANLRNRFNLHASGNVKSTKNRLPVTLIFYETYLNKYDAIRREDYLKSSKGKITIRNMLKEYIRSIHSEQN